MTQVKDEHIKNTRIRKIFFNLPDAQSLVGIRSMTYIGKVAWSPNHYPPKQLLTAFSYNPRPKSGIIMTNKKAIANNLHLLLPNVMEETHISINRTTGETTNKRIMNKNGELKLWLEIALNKEEWAYHIRKLQQPGIPIQPPNPNRPRRQPSTHSNTDRDEVWQLCLRILAVMSVLSVITSDRGLPLAVLLLGFALWLPGAARVERALDAALHNLPGRREPPA